VSAFGRLQGVLVALTVAGALSATAGELAVAPGGFSAADALARIRAARKSGDTAKWNVRVSGFNLLDKTLCFTEEDHDIDFVGEPGATLSGGTRLTGWRKNPAGWWEIDLPRQADGSFVYVEQLWVGGRRASHARLPNEGYFHVVKPVVAKAAAGCGHAFVERATLTNGEAKVLAQLSPPDLPHTQFCLISKWTHARRILRGYDAATGTFETWSPGEWRPWQEWNDRETLVWFENVRSAFDAPGEWFSDMTVGKLCYRPLPGEDMTKLEAVAPFAKLSRLVDMRGDYRHGKAVRNISFRNVRFAYAEATPTTGDELRQAHLSDGYVVSSAKDRPVECWQYQAAAGSDGALTFEGVCGVSLVDCEILHTGNYGLRFNSGCVSNSVVDCTLAELGAGGIFMGSRLDCPGKDGAIARRILRPTRPDATAFNLISNCTITCAGRYNPEGTGVALTHCSDTKVVHNEIRDIYYTGVSVGLVWGFAGSVAQRNEIAWNRISDLGKSVMSDMGGVYTLGTSFGTCVHHNEIHDVWSYSYGGWALYCDEGSEGIVMEDNVCWNTTDGGFHQHYGAGCVIRNNVFAFNRERGAVRMVRDVVQGVPCTLNFVNNIVCVRQGPLAGRGVRNVGGVWANNVWWDFRGLSAAEFDGVSWDAWTKSGKERGSVFADPKFADAAKHDFTLKPDSPALALGFRPIDLKGAGPVR